MNGEQYGRNSINQSILNEQERSSYTASFFVDNIKPSSNNQFRGVSKVGERIEDGEWRGVNLRERTNLAPLAILGRSWEYE